MAPRNDPDLELQLASSLEPGEFVRRLSPWDRPVPLLTPSALGFLLGLFGHWRARGGSTLLFSLPAWVPGGMELLLGGLVVSTLGILHLFYALEDGYSSGPVEDPERPWLGDHPWTGSEVRDDSRAHSGRVKGMAALLWVAGFLLLAGLDGGEPATALALAVAVGGLGLGFREDPQVRRFGSTRLHLSEFPLHPGRSFSAELVLDQRGPLPEELLWTLRRVELPPPRVVATGRYVSRTYDVVAVARVVTPVAPPPGEIVARAHFDLPGDVPGTDLAAGRFWQLDVTSMPPGGESEDEVPPFQARFLLPVYQAPEPRAPSA